MDAVAYFPGDISIVDFAGLCAHGLSDSKPGATYINIFLGNGFQLGTTQVGGTSTTLNVQTLVVDAQCNSVGANASGGSVTITKADSGTVSGTFDFTAWRRASAFTGSPSARPCARCAGSTRVQVSVR